MTATSSQPTELATLFGESWVFPKAADKRALAILAARTVEMAGPLDVGQARPTLIACHGKGEAAACEGFYLVMKLPRELIRPICPVCRHCPFVLTKWQESRWAAGVAPAFSPGGLAQEHGIASAQQRADRAREAETWEKLAAQLKRCRSSMTVAQVQSLVEHAKQPADMLAAFVKALPTDLRDQEAEAIISLAFDAWQLKRGTLDL